MTLFARAGVLLLAAFLAACYPTSEQPIGASGSMTPDLRLLGAWKSLPNKQDGPSYVFFLSHGEGKIEAMTVSAPSDGGKGEWMSFDVRTANVGGHDFMNGRQLFDNGDGSNKPAGDYTPVFYRLQGDTLQLFTLDTDAVEAAIRKGEIKGEIKESGFGDDVRLTADAAALDAFFAGHDPNTLFIQQLGAYRRMKE